MRSKVLRQRTALLGLVVWIVGGSAMAQEVEQLPSVQLPPELDRVLRDYERAWVAKDAAGLAALYVEDGFALANGGPPVRGRKGIEKRYEGSGGPVVLRALAHATDGSLGYIIGGFAWKKGESDVGSFTLTLRRHADGRWLIMSDSWLNMSNQDKAG